MNWNLFATSYLTLLSFSLVTGTSLQIRNGKMEESEIAEVSTAALVCFVMAVELSHG